MNRRDILDFFGEQGLISHLMPGFEFRFQQVRLAEAVARSLDSGSHLVAEAGTGTGKSLAYLLPAVLWAVENNKKVVVSTYTKNLQQQILYHDIPFIRQKLGLAFRYSICMGHENYLSLRRLKRAGQAGLFTDPEADSQMGRIFDWAGQTATGLKEELDFDPLSTVWEEVGRQKDLCMGKNCPTYSSCFYFKERRKWFASHLLVVNHHLFFANVASQGAILPRFDAVVFDEAQNLEEAATHFLGIEISNSGLFYFLDRLYNLKTQRGILSRVEHPETGAVRDAVAKTRRAAETLFEVVLEDFGRKNRVVRFYRPPGIPNPLQDPLVRLRESLKILEGLVEGEEDRLELSAAANRCFEIENALSAFLNQQMSEYVYWLEIAERKRFPRVVFQGVPINVGDELKEQVFNRIDRMVLTSATLTTNGDFQFIKERIGYEPREEMILDSPFDYPLQALLYVPHDLPEPSEEIDVYVEALSKRCRELVHLSRGRTFILFTSYSILNRVFVQMEDLRGTWPLLRQGDLPRSQMIEKFKTTPSVIFGTTSFWQGVDIPGDALTSVIITKLPFDVPNEPLTEARLEDLRRKAIDPFSHYQIPRAILMLKQGFGRLIRKRTDTGIVSILDSRVVRRGYGQRFLESLPPCRVVNHLDEVQKFLDATDLPRPVPVVD
ncbi:MAG: helicase c2 [Nitrospinae bacterium CG11_big_fil_rev_8_21_14_0_20_56_8]|nr:MAG: helicase c2 [Nitrospinae bacterium CG11_big_fil_rev_8_21_14_0_20_56_8]